MPGRDGKEGPRATDRLFSARYEARRKCAVWRGRAKQPWKVEVERVKGIEPSYAAWEAAVLPLNYTRMGSNRNGPARTAVGAPLPC